MRPKSWIRNFHGQMAISAGYQPDGRLEVKIGDGDDYHVMTEAEWGALPLYYRPIPFFAATR
jgi:hypothetical protein